MPMALMLLQGLEISAIILIGSLLSGMVWLFKKQPWEILFISSVSVAPILDIANRFLGITCCQEAVFTMVLYAGLGITVSIIGMIITKPC